MPIPMIAYMLWTALMQVQAPPAQLNPGIETNGACLGSAFLNTSFEAEQALQQAQRHIQRGHWSVAAPAYQNIGEKYGGFLIRRDKTHFVALRHYINEQIAAWPAEGRAAYRDNFDRVARRAYEAVRGSDDIAAYLSVANRFYPTRVGAMALDTAAQIAIEQGRFQSARQWYATLMATHPDSEASKKLWKAKIAFCDAWCGNLSSLEQLQRAYPAEHPGPQITWAGHRQTLGDFIQQRLQQIKANQSRRPCITEPDASPGVFAGGTGRRAFYHTTAVAEARLWRFTAFGPSKPKVDIRTDSLVAGRDAYLRALQNGRLLSMVPVYGDGLIFGHDASTVWAVNPDDADHAVWRFSRPATAPPDPQWMNEEEPADQYTTLLAGGRLYVHLDRQVNQIGSDEVRTTSELVCLNARNGQLIWQNPLDGIASRFEDVLLDGAPLLHHGLLYAVARRRKAFGFEACLLLCLDPATGRLRWQTHLGEAPTGSYGYHRPTRTHPAAAGDLIFVHTNLGTIAAVSATSGRVSWLTCYKSKYSDGTDAASLTRYGQSIQAWQYQPTLLWRDAVVCMPLDLDEILILSQSDGRLRRRLPLEDLFDPQSIMGLDEDRLFCAGRQVVCYDLGNEKIIWQRPLIDGQLFGRGLVTSNGLFVPTNRALLHYPLDGGPANIHRWTLAQAGNLLALPDQIVVASSQSLYGLLSKQDSLRRLTQRMQQRPKDASAALALADLAFKTGAYQRGIAAAREAVDRFGGFMRLPDEQTRHKLFDRLLQFSRFMLDDASGSVSAANQAPPDPEQLDTVIELLKMAGQCTADLNGKIVYRLMLGRAFLLAGRFKDAVRSYQQILSDRSLRGLRLRLDRTCYPPDFLAHGRNVEPPPDVSVAGLAKVWIGQLMIQHGASIYDAVERQARNRFKIATAQSDQAAMWEVAEAFPNSRTAVDALLASARLAVNRQRWSIAIRSFRRVLSRLDVNVRPNVLQELIFAFISVGQDRLADQWLERAGRDYPSFRLDYQGRQMGFMELRRLLMGNRHFHDVASPVTTWPVREAFRHLFSDRLVILDPIFRHLPETRWDTFVAYSAGQLEARNARTGRSLWPHPFDCPAQPALLGMDAARDYYATAGRLFALMRRNGRLAWQYGQAPPDDPNADPEDSRVWTDYVLTTRHLLAASDRGELVCIDRSSGDQLWRREYDDHTAEHLAAGNGRVFFTQWKDHHSVIQMLDAETGRDVRTIQTGQTRPLQRLVPTQDGLLLVVLTRSILSIHPPSGSIRWHNSTPGRYVLNTLMINEEGLFISDDGQSITKYELDNGQIAWKTPPVGADSRSGLWTQVVGGRLLAAVRHSLAAFDTTDGRLLWKVANPSGLQWQSPIVVAGSLLTVSRVKPTFEKRDPDFPPIHVGKTTWSYRIHRFNLEDGQQRTLTEQGPLLTEPFDSFGGLFVRNQCLLLLDGDRLIGYVSRK